MSIIQCFTNNIQLNNLIYSNLKLQAKIKTLTDENLNLKRKLSNSKKNNTKLKTKIKKILGTYEKPISDTSRSALYEYFKVEKEAITKPIVDISNIKYQDLLNNRYVKHSKAYLKPNFQNPNQLCPRCNSPKEYHYMHTKTQKRCKICFKTFIFKEKEVKLTNRLNNFFCPFCSKKLVFRISRVNFDVYVCKNKSCSYRVQKTKDIISKYGNLNNRDKVSYIYRDIKLSINNLFKFNNDTKLNTPKSNFIFRNFNSRIFSLVISYKVNLKLSNRDTASAMKDFYGIDISHTTINTYCKMASQLITYLNTNEKPEKISNRIVGDETYIKIKGKKHYVWILYDLEYKNVITYHISDKRDMSACAVVFLKLIECYKDKPKELFVMSDKYTAYPLALQFIQKELGIEIHHTSVKGLQEVPGEDSDTRIAKQKIERLNRVFKETYRITTGYFNLIGARYSFELWMFYFNYMRRENGKFKNTLNFIDTQINVDTMLMPDKWSYVFEYIKLKLSS